MFTIDNHLYERRFQYNPNTLNYMEERETELLNLQEIGDYCRGNDESLLCDLNNFYSTEVEPGVSLSDWVFTNQGTGSHDARSLLLYMLDSIKEFVGEGDGEILISLGVYEDCASTVDEYKEKRRAFLAKMKNAEEFAAFMGSCFQNTVFSDNIISSMKKIPRFRECVGEIVFNLALLNDCAVKIYEKHNFNASEAMKELSARALECTGDPAHKAFLKFPFSYLDGENDIEERWQIKEIECSPHMKLIRRDSNLRIYFYWFDGSIGEGEKVLIGHIGAHPY